MALGDRGTRPEDTDENDKSLYTLDKLYTTRLKGAAIRVKSPGLSQKLTAQ